MAPYLEEHPPVRSQYRKPRREEPSGVVVVHTAENAPDFVAFDGGAEAVANFIVHRDDAGSYHDLADSDSDIQLVAYDAEAFHDATGSNPHSYGVSGATRADVWPLAPPEWRAGCVRNMARCAARYATWLVARRGIVIPARRITRDESELRVPGFISHAERDPARRTDPGATFPWADFLAEYAQLIAPPPPTAPTEDDMPYYIRNSQNGAAYRIGVGAPLHQTSITAYQDDLTLFKQINYRSGADCEAHLAAAVADWSTKAALTGIAEDTDAILAELTTVTVADTVTDPD